LICLATWRLPVASCIYSHNIVASLLGWLRHSAVQALKCMHCCSSHLSTQQPLPICLTWHAKNGLPLLCVVAFGRARAASSCGCGILRWLCNSCGNDCVTNQTQRLLSFGKTNLDDGFGKQNKSCPRLLLQACTNVRIHCPWSNAAATLVSVQFFLRKRCKGPP